ncbi:TetR family transcriptional regulator [Actinomadura keratinilytica]
MTSRPDLSLAQRKRQLVADELTEAALQLLALSGFDGVTVDEIVAAAGVSKRTFFRYFASRRTWSSSSSPTWAPTCARSWPPAPPGNPRRPRSCAPS